MKKTIPVTPPSCDDVPPGTLSVEQALIQIDALITPIEETVTLALTEALQHVLAEAVSSPINVPPHRNSAMDGYAVRATDLSEHDKVNLRYIKAFFCDRSRYQTIKRAFPELVKHGFLFFLR